MWEEYEIPKTFRSQSGEQQRTFLFKNILLRQITCFGFKITLQCRLFKTGNCKQEKKALYFLFFNMAKHTPEPQSNSAPHRWRQCPCLSAITVYFCIPNNRKCSFEIHWEVCPHFGSINSNYALRYWQMIRPPLPKGIILLGDTWPAAAFSPASRGAPSKEPGTRLAQRKSQPW